MDGKKFIKEKMLLIVLVLFGLITIEIFLMVYPVDMFLKIYIPLAITIMLSVGLSYEYCVKKSYYTNLQTIMEELDDKYLITELIKDPAFTEGKILKYTLQQANKSMTEHVNHYKYLQEDYKEYIELWIHEIKLPIAASKMVIENNKNAVTKSIDEELDKVENYIEQALFYARSNHVDKDYYIKKVALKEIVSESIKKNKNGLIQAKIAVDLHDLDREVHTDSKWIVFILNQLIQNSIKYRKQNHHSEIEVYSVQGKECVILYVKDNGIGIAQGDLARVFEKGFTGTNGRLSNKKSTGIGLYLCKKLCDKLGMGIEIRSVPDEGTEIRLIFPQGSYKSFVGT